MKSYIEESTEIPELYDIKHKHDVIKNHGFNYTKNLFTKSISPVLFKNDTNALFLNYLKNMYVSMIDTILPVRNIFFYTHSKYYNGHGK